MNRTAMSPQRGMLLFETEDLKAMVKKCHEAGMQIAIHAIGDGAVDEVMDAIEEAKQKYHRLNERHGIIHCQVTTPAQLERMKRLDLIAYIQPIFLNYDLKILDSRLGEKRAATAYDWKSFFDKELHPTGSSDCPVESLNIMENIYAAMTRKDLNGNPQGGWKPEQNLSLEQCLRLFTINSAYTCFAEEKKGSIRKGKSADFVVIDRDIAKTAPDDIKDIKIERTYLAGKKLYDMNR
ncbi:MAG: amidohydrolase family protein [Firmicutes bacterium]|nr:amidohydrolase family protein [Bacillota bacterium]